MPTPKTSELIDKLTEKQIVSFFCNDCWTWTASRLFDWMCAPLCEKCGKKMK